MSAIKPTARDNQAVALLDHPGVALAVCLLGGILISVTSLIIRFSTEVTNRQKGEDFHSRQPSPISLTQPSGTIAPPQVTPQQRLGARFKAA
jgi:hypothetical protein